MDKGMGQSRRTLDRREFIQKSTKTAILAGVTIQILGCEGEKYLIDIVEDAAPDESADDVALADESALDDDEMDDDDGESESPPPKMCSDADGDIDSNHGHTAVVSASQQEAGASVTVTLSLGNGHTHTVSLSGSEVASLCDGGSVTKESSEDAFHTHSVTFVG